MNILIVDDHPMIVSFYEKILERDFRYLNTLSIITASNCKQAYEHLTNPEPVEFDFVILDHNLPKYEQESINTGTDIAIWLLKLYF